LDEAQEGAIVQVVDTAVIPDKRAFPPRTLLTIGVTIFSFLLALFYLVVQKRFKVASELPENRQRLQDIKEFWNTKSRAS
jgi:uncharacterized protein involved in exopolysaccharide biosynthesis